MIRFAFGIDGPYGLWREQDGKLARSGGGGVGLPAEGCCSDP